MDKLDVKVLRELLQGQTEHPIQSDVRKSIREVAKRLTVDEDTVRKRLGRFRDTGFLLDWQLFVNPRLAGLMTAALFVEGIPRVSKADVFDRLRLVPGAWLWVVNFEDSAGLLFHPESELALAREAQLVSRLFDAKKVLAMRVPMPEPGVALSDRDWKVVAALRRDPRKSYNTVASSLGVSSRTVKRRLNRLAQNGALFGFAVLDPKALEGVLWAELLVFYTTQDLRPPGRPEILERLDDFYFHVSPASVSQPAGAGTCDMVSLLVPSMAKARGIVDWVRTRSDVASARIYLEEDRYHLLDDLQGYIEEKARARRGKSVQRS